MNAKTTRLNFIKRPAYCEVRRGRRVKGHSIVLDSQLNNVAFDRQGNVNLYIQFATVLCYVGKQFLDASSNSVVHISRKHLFAGYLSEPFLGRYQFQASALQ